MNDDVDERRRVTQESIDRDAVVPVDETGPECPANDCDGRLVRVSHVHNDMAFAKFDRNHQRETFDCLKCKRRFSRSWAWELW